MSCQPVSLPGEGLMAEAAFTTIRSPAHYKTRGRTRTVDPLETLSHGAPNMAESLNAARL